MAFVFGFARLSPTLHWQHSRCEATAGPSWRYLDDLKDFFVPRRVCTLEVCHYLHLRRGLTGLVWECSILSADSSESAFGMSSISVDGVRAVRWMLVRSLSSTSTMTIKSTESRPLTVSIARTTREISFFW